MEGRQDYCGGGGRSIPIHISEKGPDDDGLIKSEQRMHAREERGERAAKEKWEQFATAAIHKNAMKWGTDDNVVSFQTGSTVFFP